MKRYRVFLSYQPERVSGSIEVEANSIKEAKKDYNPSDVEWESESAYFIPKIKVDEVELLEDDERSCVKCGRTSCLIEEEDICYTCAKERGRV